MLKNVLFKTVVLISVLALASACGGGDDESWEDDYYESDETELTTDVPTSVDDGSSPTCLTTMEGMLNFDDDSEDDSGDDDFEGSDLEFDDEIILVTYQVLGDEISDPIFAEDIPEELVSYQEDTARHQEIWQFVTAIIPTDQRTILGEFIIFSDGMDNVLGAVDDADAASMWTLEVDIIDSQDLAGLSTTLIHEFGHMVTMNDDQIGGDSASCSTYASDDGCSKEDSYIYAFYDRFWSGIYDEWSSTTNNGDEDLIEDFYNEYPDQFVSDYAATSPEEDIAETWTYFIFSPEPSGDGIADQKVQFFYEYPDLVRVRQQIINGLCPYIGG